MHSLKRLPLILVLATCAGFSQAAPYGFRDYFGNLQAKCQKALASQFDILGRIRGHRFTGYFGEVWTPELFHRVTQEDGLYSPLIRNYSWLSGLSLTDSAKKLDYLRQAPDEILTLLIASHMVRGDSVGGNATSPFLSTSRSMWVGADFGPYHVSLNTLLFKSPNMQRPKSWAALFTTNPEKTIRMASHVSEDKIASALQSIKQAMGNQPTSTQAEGIRDWLVAHRWLTELMAVDRGMPGLLFGKKAVDWNKQKNIYEPNPENFSELLEEYSRSSKHLFLFVERLQNKLNGFVGMTQVKNMSIYLRHARKEKEETALFHIPKEQIVSAELYDPEKVVVSKYIRD